MPESGKIYSFNEGNYGMWAPHLRDYIDSLKDGAKWGGKPYTSRCASDQCTLLPKQRSLRFSMHAGPKKKFVA